MKAIAIRTVVAAAAAAAFSVCRFDAAAQDSEWQEEFGISECNLQTSGRNPYFILEPGYQLVLEGNDIKLQLTVLDETKTIDGVATRVVEEREWKKGELAEIAKNYFAICEPTMDVFYCGPEVDYYFTYTVPLRSRSRSLEPGRRGEV